MYAALKNITLRLNASSNTLQTIWKVGTFLFTKIYKLKKWKHVAIATGATKITMVDTFFQKNVHFCHLGQFFSTNSSWNIIFFTEVLVWYVGNAKQAKNMQKKSVIKTYDIPRKICWNKLTYMTKMYIFLEKSVRHLDFCSTCCHGDSSSFPSTCTFLERRMYLLSKYI